MPPHACFAALVTLMALAAGPLPPGALSAQAPTSVSVASLEAGPVRAAPGPGFHPVDRAGIRPAGPSGIRPGAHPSLRLPAGPDRDAFHPAVRAGAAGTASRRPAEPPSVLDAVLILARPSEPAPGDARDSFGTLGDVLPRELCRDLLELRARIQRYRTVLFGRRGIVRFGELDGADRLGRVRLNLQTDPEPGFRVTLVTG